MEEPIETHGTAPEDARTRYDAMRSRGPVCREGDSWLLLGHPEVVAAALDPATFSSVVSTRRAIPNTLDGEEHAAYRAVVDRYLSAGRIAVVEPLARAVAVELIEALPREQTVKTIIELGIPFAVRTQSAWLGWPRELEPALVAWMGRNHAATRSGDRARTREVAEEFDAMIQGLIDARREGPATDVTGELMGETVGGRALTDAETVSILRNWTASDLSSIASSVGVIVHFLANHAELQREVRGLVAAGDAAAVETAAEEMLRIDDPFVSSRRRSTREVELGHSRIEPDSQVALNWTAANRDPRVFADPDRYEPVANAGANLVFGIGPHVCPGRALTLMELRVVTEELLSRTSWVEPASDRLPARGAPPIGGWTRVPVVLR